MEDIETLPTLTLWPEWAWAICHLGKRVENRTWQPPAWLLGERIGIHAGRYIGGRPGKPACREGRDAVRRVAGLAGVPWCTAWDAAFTEGGLTGMPRGALVAVARLSAVDDEDRGGWDAPDHYHWRLDNVVVLDEPVAYRGGQGIWWLCPELARPPRSRHVEVRAAGAATSNVTWWDDEVTRG